MRRLARRGAATVFLLGIAIAIASTFLLEEHIRPGGAWLLRMILLSSGLLYLLLSDAVIDRLLPGPKLLRGDPLDRVRQATGGAIQEFSVPIYNARDPGED